MGLMDKVKQVAGEMGEAAKKGATQVQSKVEQTQLRRKADDAAKRLGYLVYRERTGGAAAAGAEADGLVTEIREAEEQIAAADAATEAATAEPVMPPTSTAEMPASPTSAAEMPPPAPGQAVEEATGE